MNIPTARVTLTLSPSELDLIRDTLRERHVTLVSATQDASVDVRVRADARATAMRIGDLLGKLDA